jgi:hypothetical protein
MMRHHAPEKGHTDDSKENWRKTTAASRRKAAVAQLVRASLLRAGTADDPRGSEAAIKENYKIYSAAAVRVHQRARFHHAALGAETIDQLRGKDTSYRQPAEAHLAQFTRSRMAGPHDGSHDPARSPRPSSKEDSETEIETIDAAVRGMRVNPPVQLARIRGGLVRNQNNQNRDARGEIPVQWAQPGDGALIARKLHDAGYSANDPTRVRRHSEDDDVVKTSATMRHRGAHARLRAANEAKRAILPDAAAPIDQADENLVAGGLVKLSLGAIKRAFVFPFNASQHLPSSASGLALGETSSASDLRKPWSLPSTSTGVVPVSTRPFQGRGINAQQFDAPLDPISRAQLRTSKASQPHAKANRAPPVIPVPGRGGDKMGFGASVAGSARLVLARQASAIEEVLAASAALHLTPADVAETQNELAEALPMLLIFRGSASTRGGGKLQLIPRSEPRQGQQHQHQQTEMPGSAVAAEQAGDMARALQRDRTSAHLRKRAVALLRSQAIMPVHARAVASAAPTLAVLRQARADVESGASRLRAVQAQRHARGMPPLHGEGALTTDSGVARAAQMRLSTPVAATPIVDAEIDAREGAPVATADSSRVVDSLVFLRLSQQAELVDAEIADTVTLLRSGGFRLVLGLAVHFVFWRVVRPMAVCLASRHAEATVGTLQGKQGTLPNEVNLLRLLIRSWCVFEGMSAKLRVSHTARSVLLLALKAGVEAQLRSLCPRWASFDRSVGFFYQRFGSSAEVSSFADRIPMMIPTHAQIDALLSACFDTSRVASTIPGLAVSHEALHKLSKARAIPPVRGLGIPRQRPATSDPATQRQPLQSGLDVVSVVHGLPYSSQATTLLHLTSSFVHAALPSIQHTPSARGIIAPGDLASRASLSAAALPTTPQPSALSPVDGRPASSSGPATEAELLHIAVLRRMCVAYQQSSSRQPGHAERLAALTDVLLSASTAHRRALRHSVFRQAAVLLAGRTQGTSGVLTARTVAKAVEDAARGKLATGTSPGARMLAAPTRAQTALAETTDLLEFGCWRTANDVLRRSRNAAALSRPGEAHPVSPRGIVTEGALREVPLHAQSPLRVCEALIGASWAEEQERDLAQVYEQVRVFRVLNPNSPLAQATTPQSLGATAEQRKKPSQAGGRKSSRSGYQPKSSVAAQGAVLALAMSGSKSILMHAQQTTTTALATERRDAHRMAAHMSEGLALPVDAEGITRLLAARSPMHPSPFSKASVEESGPTGWLRGPGARARKAEVEAAKTTARAEALRSAVKRSAVLVDDRANVMAVRAAAARAPSATDSGMVLYLRQVLQERLSKGLSQSLPDPTPLEALAIDTVSLVGEPDSWELGLADAGALRTA